MKVWFGVVVVGSFCVRVDEIFDDFHGDMMSTVCAVCVRYQSLRGECE